MNITTTNVTKVISIATGVYWVLAVFAFWSDIHSNSFGAKDGWWIAVMLLSGTCGVAFWGMIAPVALRALRANPLPRSLAALARGTWYVSTIPIVLLCFGLVSILIYRRVCEG